jgi:hypothetical protein
MARANFRLLATVYSCCLPFAAQAAFAPPVGIYSLGAAIDNPVTTADERLAGIRNYDFVSGYTLRLLWKDIETSQGNYNFAVIDEAIKRAAAIGQRVNLEVLDAQPSYVISGSAATYIDHRNEIRTVPWDAFAQTRFAALQSALASHTVNDGQGLRLNQHPVLASVDASGTGLNYGVRDLNNGIRSHPDYTQQKYIQAVVQGVAASRQAFSQHQGYIAFFGFVDGQSGVPVDKQLIQLLDDQYNSPGQPTLSFFIENLSDRGPSATSSGAGVNLQDWTTRGGTTMMQALDSWLVHRPDRDPQLASLNPATGIELAYNSFGTRFFELYVPDLDGAVNGAVDAANRPLLDDLRYWNSVIVPEPSNAAVVALIIAALCPRRVRPSRCNGAA